MLVYAITPRVFDGAGKCRSGPVGFAVGNKTGTGAVTGTRCWQRRRSVPVRAEIVVKSQEIL